MELPSIVQPRPISIGRASRRSASRGSQLNYRELSGVRPVTRGRSHTVGSRRLQRWLNDNMVYLYGNFWNGLSEYEFQERLAHMYVDISRKPSVFEELQSMEEETKEMFRDGTLGIPQIAKASGSYRLTIRGALDNMYKRMYTRCRALLLQETRRTNSLLDAGSDIRTITTDIEYFMTLLLDGRLATIVEEFAKVPKDSDEVKYSPFSCGPEFESSLVNNVRVYRRGSPHRNSDQDSTMTGVEEPMSQLNIDAASKPAQVLSGETDQMYDVLYEVPIVDGHSRMLFIGLAQFYGVNFEVLENTMATSDMTTDHSFNGMFPSAKVVRFWLHKPSEAATSEKNNVEVVLAVRRQLHSAMLLSAADESDASMETGDTRNSDVPDPEDEKEDPHPFVPLFAVHIRTITEESMSSKRQKKQFTYGSRFRTRQPQEHMHKIREPQDVQMITQDVAHMGI